MRQTTVERWRDDYRVQQDISRAAMLMSVKTDEVPPELKNKISEFHRLSQWQNPIEDQHLTFLVIPHMRKRWSDQDKVEEKRKQEWLAKGDK